MVSVHGKDRDSIATIVDRKTGYALIGKLNARTASATKARLAVASNSIADLPSGESRPSDSHEVLKNFSPRSWVLLE